MNQNHNGVLHLTQRVLDMLQAHSPPQEGHEGQLQGLEAVGQDPDQELGVVELLLRIQTNKKIQSNLIQ